MQPAFPERVSEINLVRDSTPALAAAPLRNREIERLRAVAVLLVVLTHADRVPFLYASLPFPLRGGRLGVDLFFVISGFVVTRSLLRLLPNLTPSQEFPSRWESSLDALKIFYCRRLFRIVPLLLAAVLLQRVLLGVDPDLGNKDTWLQEVLLVGTTLYNYAVPSLWNSQLGGLWSLCVEEHFYLTLPLLLLAVTSRSRRLLACAIGMGLVVFVFRPFFTPPADADPDLSRYFLSHLRFDAPLVGVILALLPDPRTGAATSFLPPQAFRWVVVPLAIVLLWSIPQIVPAPAMYNVGFVGGWAASGLLVSLAIRERGYVLDLPVVGRWLEYIGSRSYGIYLLHGVPFRFDALIAKRWPWYAAHVSAPFANPWLFGGAWLLMTLVLVETGYRAIEAPGIRLGRFITAGPREWPATPRVFRRALIVGVALVLAYQSRWWVHRLLGPPNLALHAAVTASSQLNGTPPSDALTNGWLEPALGLHTERESNPWARIDLRVVRPIGEVRIYNRADGWQDEILPLALETSVDGQTYTRLAVATTLFTQDSPWIVPLHAREARFLRVEVLRTGTLCLSEIEIFAPR